LLFRFLAASSLVSFEIGARRSSSMGSSHLGSPSRLFVTFLKFKHLNFTLIIVVTFELNQILKFLFESKSNSKLSTYFNFHSNYVAIQSKWST
jgi:hypothetical protein